MGFQMLLLKGQRVYGNPNVIAVKDSFNRQLIAPRENKEMAIESGNRKLDSDDVRRMFLEGMGSSGNLEVLSVYRCSSPSLQTRLELFEKEIKITETYLINSRQFGTRIS
ncbi:hypothetical protein L484_017738 [Morus notabilis]|uniref:Uncharacterized protein n=1 Tax=Morus notabilis TaxID=981085 RepID=W9R340_9ROSA|nr:hypothetical protein L484_017738 [Morus notabilis]